MENFEKKLDKYGVTKLYNFSDVILEFKDYFGMDILELKEYFTNYSILEWEMIVDYLIDINKYLGLIEY